MLSPNNIITQILKNKYGPNNYKIIKIIKHNNNQCILKLQINFDIKILIIEFKYDKLQQDTLDSPTLKSTQNTLDPPTLKSTQNIVGDSYRDRMLQIYGCVPTNTGNCKSDQFFYIDVKSSPQKTYCCPTSNKNEIDKF